MLEFRWTYADPSWARIAALVPVVVSCADAGDEVANKILLESVEELASSVKAVVQRLGLCGEGVAHQTKIYTFFLGFPFIMISDHWFICGGIYCLTKIKGLYLEVVAAVKGIWRQNIS